MKVSQTITPAPVNLIIPIAKVDKEKRLVKGVATAEVVDTHGEIVDYESAKAAFEKWGGNIREMHQPKAVGKSVSVEFDDDNRQIIVESYISKGAPDTWEKVCDGTLSMYSIGGEGSKVKDKVAKAGRILLGRVTETSLVDAGACPVAKFEIVKMDGDQPVACQPEEPAEEAPAAAAPAKVAIGKAALLDLVATMAAAPRAKASTELLIAKIADGAEELVVKKAFPRPYMIQRTLGAIACLEDILADEWWTASDAASRGEDNGTDLAQLQVLRSAIELVLAYLVSEFNAQFSDLDAAEEVETAKSARRLALVEDVEKALPIVFGKLDTTGQLWIAKAGARHSKSDVAMIQAMHDSALALGAMCPVAEAAKAAAAAATPDAPIAAVETPATEEAPAAAAAEPVGKSADAAPAVAAEPIATTELVAEPVLTLDSIQKLIDQALTAQKATSDQTIAALEARVVKQAEELETLKATPRPGGPVARATEGTPVHKSIGGVAADGDVTPDQVLAVAGELSKTASAGERQQLAASVLKYMHSTGAGSVAVRPGAVKE